MEWEEDHEWEWETRRIRFNADNQRFVVHKRQNGTYTVHSFTGDMRKASPQSFNWDTKEFNDVHEMRKHYQGWKASVFADLLAMPA
jgi:hypothetical protein